MEKRISRDSVEDIWVEVLHTTVAGAAADPSAYPVEIAVLPGGDSDPEPSDWIDATWAQGPRSKVATALIGPLAPGRYGVWVRITATPPRVPVLRADWALLVY